MWVIASSSENIPKLGYLPESMKQFNSERKIRPLQQLGYLLVGLLKKGFKNAWPSPRPTH